jgi:RNA polymerase sigma factor (sigma-70 family)
VPLSGDGAASRLRGLAVSDRIAAIDSVTFSNGRWQHSSSGDGGLDMDDGVAIEDSWSTPERFAEIFDRHYVALFAFCARRIGAASADDVVNEAFCVAFDRRRNYDTQERPNARPWLMGIAINVMRHEFRRRLREARAFDRLTTDESLPDHDSSVVDGFEAFDQMHRVRAALAHLPDQELEALLLSVLERQTYGQIAEVMQTPVGTVRSRIHRARRHLSDLLGEASDTSHRPTSKG